jgi:hypothetical protein
MRTGMRKWIVVAIVLVLAATLTQVSAQTQTQKTDARVAVALTQAGFKYVVGEAGDFRFVIELKGGRTQLVFINSVTETVGNIEIREVWSIGYMGSEVMSSLIMEVMLRDNANKKLGAWGLSQINNLYVGTFSIKMSAESSGSVLRTIAEGVAMLTDDMESKISTADNF